MKQEILSARIKHCLTLLSLIFFACIVSVRAQTTAFTYQGRFTDSTVMQPTGGSYNMTFRLFDAATGGNQIPNNSTAINALVTVTNGIFTVQLDFGAAAFTTSQARYLEIQVGSIVLTPRQEITSTPFAVRAVSAANADSLGGLPANQFVQTNDSRLSDSRAPTAGSGNYIQNTTTQQSANFNVSGSGTLGGALTAGKAAINGGVLARGGAPGGFGVNNNGYAFSGNGGDNDSGLFSDANGRVSVYTDSVERVRVDGGGINVTGNITATGTINGVVKDVNGLSSSVTLAAGSGINLTSSGNTLTFSLANAPLKRFVVGGLIGGYQYSVVHNLNTVDVVVQVYDQNGFLIFLRNVNNGTSDGFAKVVDANTVLLGVYPAGTYRVVIIG